MCRSYLVRALIDVTGLDSHTYRTAISAESNGNAPGPLFVGRPSVGTLLLILGHQSCTTMKGATIIPSF